MANHLRVMFDPCRRPSSCGGAGFCFLKHGSNCIGRTGSAVGVAGSTAILSAGRAPAHYRRSGIPEPEYASASASRFPCDWKSSLAGSAASSVADASEGIRGKFLPTFELSFGYLVSRVGSGCLFSLSLSRARQGCFPSGAPAVQRRPPLPPARHRFRSTKLMVCHRSHPTRDGACLWDGTSCRTACYAISIISGAGFRNFDPSCCSTTKLVRSRVTPPPP